MPPRLQPYQTCAQRVLTPIFLHFQIPRVIVVLTRVKAMTNVFFRGVWLLMFTCAMCQMPLEVELHLSVVVPLLSGGITGCPTPNASTCRGGLAAQLAYVRARRALGKKVMTVPWFVTETPFVQMHPLSWGVNALVCDLMGVTHVFASPYVFQDRRPGIERLLNSSLGIAIANAHVLPSNPFRSVLTEWAISDVGVAVTYVFDEVCLCAT